jgi:hypothetical protein
MPAHCFRRCPYICRPRPDGPGAQNRQLRGWAKLNFRSGPDQLPNACRSVRCPLLWPAFSALDTVPPAHLEARQPRPVGQGQGRNRVTENAIFSHVPRFTAKCQTKGRWREDGRDIKRRRRVNTNPVPTMARISTSTVIALRRETVSISSFVNEARYLTAHSGIIPYTRYLGKFIYLRLAGFRRNS